VAEPDEAGGGATAGTAEACIGQAVFLHAPFYTMQKPGRQAMALAAGFAPELLGIDRAARQALMIIPAHQGLDPTVILGVR